MTKSSQAMAGETAPVVARAQAQAMSTGMMAAGQVWGAESCQIRAGERGANAPLSSECCFVLMFAFLFGPSADRTAGRTCSLIMRGGAIIEEGTGYAVPSVKI